MGWTIGYRQQAGVGRGWDHRCQPASGCRHSPAEGPQQSLTRCTTHQATIAKPCAGPLAGGASWGVDRLNCELCIVESATVCGYSVPSGFRPPLIQSGLALPIPSAGFRAAPGVQLQVVRGVGCGWLSRPHGLGPSALVRRGEGGGCMVHCMASNVPTT